MCNLLLLSLENYSEIVRCVDDIHRYARKVFSRSLLSFPYDKQEMHYVKCLKRMALIQIEVE